MSKVAAAMPTFTVANPNTSANGNVSADPTGMGGPYITLVNGTVTEGDCDLFKIRVGNSADSSLTDDEILANGCDVPNGGRQRNGGACARGRGCHEQTVACVGCHRIFWLHRPRRACRTARHGGCGGRACAASIGHCERARICAWRDQGPAGDGPCAHAVRVRWTALS